MLRGLSVTGAIHRAAGGQNLHAHRALANRYGAPADHGIIAGHNHVSTVMSFGTAQDDVGARVREFIASVG